MKKVMTIFGAILFASFIMTSCGSKVTVCDCLKDDGSHKKECDDLGNSMSSAEMRREMAKCK
jgi:hypothetical protein